MTGRMNLGRITAILAILASGGLISPLTAQTQRIPATPNPTFRSCLY